MLQNPDLRRVIIVDPNGAVEVYARKQFFNEVFSGKRLRCIPEAFGQSAWNAITAEIVALEQQAMI